jgi:hypothetical protein
LPKCIDYTGVKGSHSANKKTKFWIQQRSKEATEGTSGLGAPDCPVYIGQCPVHQRTPTRTCHLREFLRPARYNSPDCPVLQGSAASGTRHLGISLEPLRYNSPDCPVCTGLSGVPAEQRLFRRQRLPAAHLMRALRTQMAGAPILAHRTRNSRCPVGGPRSQKLQRSESNGSDDVAGAPDMSGVHRTVRCAIEQTASQRPLLVVGAINTPTTPPFMASKFFHFPTTTRALAFNSRHTKEIKSSPNSTQRHSD